MHNKRAPRFDEQRGASHESRTRYVRRTQPHTNTEENLGILLFLLLLSALILGCVGLSQVSWRVLPSGGDDAFGIVHVHMDGETHELETMGLVWPVYSASRCAYAFTVIGIVWAAWTMRSIWHFVRSNRGGLGRLMRGALWTSIWFLWAIMMYALLFPHVPFEGDLFYLTLGSNFTQWTQAVRPAGMQLEAHKPMQPAGMQLESATQPVQLSKAQTAWDDALGAETLEHPTIEFLRESQQSQQPPRRSLHPHLVTVAAPSLDLDALSADMLESPRAAYSPLPSEFSAVPGSSLLHLHALSSVPRFEPPARPAPRQLDSVPAFPIPTDPGAGTAGGGTDPFTSGSSSVLATQMFYAITAYRHLGNRWTFGAGYWLVLSAALVAIVLPFVCVSYIVGHWLYIRHKQSEVQNPQLIPLVVLLFCAWILGVIAFASRMWKDGVDPDDTHFGLDQFYLDASRYTVGTFQGFPDKGDRIHAASGVALALGVLGIVLGFLAACQAVYHIYDRSREWILTFVMVTSTALVWLVALIVYGAVFPHYLGAQYFEFGYSFWIALTATTVYAAPAIILFLYKIYERAQETTREERIMSIPSFAAIFGVMFTMAALGADEWAAKHGLASSGGDDHLGLIRGRVAGEWMGFRSIAQATSTKVTSAGVATLVLTLCGLACNTVEAAMGWEFVMGSHERCGRQMPLINTALGACAAILYALAAAAYHTLMPWADLPGWDLSHSWRVLVCAACWNAIAMAGYAWLAKPTLPGEPNILALAIPPPITSPRK